MKCFCCLDDQKQTIECSNCHEHCCIDCLVEANSFIHCINCKVGKFDLITIYKQLDKDSFDVFINGWMDEQKINYSNMIKPIQIQAHDYTELFFAIPEGIFEQTIYLREIIDIYMNSIGLNVCYTYGDTTILSSNCSLWILRNQSRKILTELIDDISNETWFIPYDLNFALYTDKIEDMNLVMLLNETLTASKYNLSKIMNMETLYELIRLRKRYNKSDVERKLFEFMARKMDLKKSVSFENIKPIINCERCNGVVIESNNDLICNLCHTKYCPDCIHPILNSHHHSQEDIDKWKLIKDTTKPYPKCGFRFEKLDGCDDMFCTNCHTGFIWSSSEIKLGSFHNPERQKWLKNINSESTTLSDTLREYDLETRMDISKQILDQFHDSLSIQIKELADEYVVIHNEKYKNNNLEVLIVKDIIQDLILETLMSVLMLYEKEKANKHSIYNHLNDLYSKIDVYKHIFRNYYDVYTWVLSLLKL